MFKIGSLDCHYELEHVSGERRQRRSAVTSLESDPDVRWSQGQRVKRRVKRDYLEEEEEKVEKRSSKTQLRLPWTDPMYSDQWFLV